MVDALMTLRAEPLDDCWNRIGVRGDNSCERLDEYVRCLNCPVFETAAAKLLERPIPSISAINLSRNDERSLQRQPTPDGATESFLIFRIGDAWLALPTAIFQRIVQTRQIHTLPHRQHRAVLGVVNVRGELLVCLSLAHLLEFDADSAAAPRAVAERHDQPRLLVVARAEELAAFPVDQVDGVHRLALSTLHEPPATLSQAAAAHTRAVAPWRGMTVGLLDADALFDTLNRSLG